MQIGYVKDTESIQRLIARTVATHPAGRNLVLIGGFRYRFLDGSVRSSVDIDYHWSGDLDQKQNELVDLFRRTVLPEVRRALGYDGEAAMHRGPDADSPGVRIVDLAFWRGGVAYSRIEIPVEVTRIVCADPVAIRTAGGTVFATASDADMIESKVIAILNRPVLRHRDLVDVFLFQDRFSPDASRRLRSKVRSLDIPWATVRKRIEELRTNRDYHAKAIQAVVDAQLEPAAADHVADGGGGLMILDAVLQSLDRHIQDPKDRTAEE